MGMQWQGVNLPPVPIRRASPEERAEQSAMMEAELERYLHDAELRKLRKERTTPEQRARKAAQDDVRKLRGLLREAAEANRWARIETALDGFMAFEYRRKADALRDKVKQRTARAYARAAAGCIVSAEFIADESADDLYREAFNDPAGSLQQ
jgi:hypothetical protein